IRRRACNSRLMLDISSPAPCRFATNPPMVSPVIASSLESAILSNASLPPPSVVACAQPFPRPTHGFLRRAGGEIVSFDVPESTGTVPASINNAGAITGSYIPANGLPFGFVRDPHGNFTLFAPDQGPSISPSSINNKGAITGLLVSGLQFLGFV